MLFNDQEQLTLLTF